MNMARCMLHEKKLSNNYWANIVSIKVYVLNKSATTNLQDTIPQETWDGKKVNVSLFRIFGLVAISRVPE